MRIVVDQSIVPPAERDIRGGGESKLAASVISGKAAWQKVKDQEENIKNGVGEEGMG